MKIRTFLHGVSLDFLFCFVPFCLFVLDFTDSSNIKCRSNIICQMTITTRNFWCSETENTSLRSRGSRSSQFCLLNCDSYSHQEGQRLCLNGSGINNVTKALFVAVLDFLNASSISREPLGVLALNDNDLLSLPDSDTFCALLTLERLDLSRNRIADIAPAAFNCNGNLNELLLANNSLTSVTSVFTSHVSQIQHLDLSFNFLTEFTYADYPSSSKGLNLSHNRIERFADRFAEKMTELESLDLSFNQLTHLARSNGNLHVRFPAKLRHIYLNDNAITGPPILPGWASLLSATPYGFISARDIHLERNNFSHLCPLPRRGPPVPLAFQFRYFLQGNPLLCDCQLEWLRKWTAPTDTVTSAKHVRISIEDVDLMECHRRNENHVITDKVFDLELPDDFLCSADKMHPSGKSCTAKGDHFGSFDLVCPPPCSCFRNSDFSFVVIRCSRLSLDRVPPPPKALATLDVYLDGNHILALDARSPLTKYYRNVRKLFLNATGLRTVTALGEKLTARLEVLHLDGNLLTELPSDLFSTSKNGTSAPLLVELFLNDNRLTRLPSATFFALLPSLRRLTLHGNRLVDFPVWESLQTILEQRLQVTLHGNPWTCSCEFVRPFREWIYSFLGDVMRINEPLLTCEDVSDNRTIVHHALLLANRSNGDSTAVCAPEAVVQLSGEEVVWITSSSGITLLLLATFAFALFVHRREMQAIVYARYGIRLFETVDEDTAECWTFDVFLSYDPSDEDFVTLTLLPGLRTTMKAPRFCDRGYRIGAFFNQNIEEAVEKSRRTLIILSEASIKNGWCTFEFQMAHAQMLQDATAGRRRGGASRIVVISMFKNGVPSHAYSKMYPELAFYLKHNTYLTWGEPFFWEKLHYAIPG